MLEQKFGTVSVSLVGQRTDGAVYRDQRSQRKHQGNAPKDSVTFEPLTDACEEFVHLYTGSIKVDEQRF